MWDEHFIASRTWKACSAAGWPANELMCVGKPTQWFVMPADLCRFETWFKQNKTDTQLNSTVRARS